MLEGFRSKPLVTLEKVSVSFPIYQGGSRSLKKHLLFRGTGGHLASDANERIVVEALRDVSLSIAAGETHCARRRQRRRQDYPIARDGGRL